MSGIRHKLSWLLIGAGVLVVVVSLVNGFTSDPQAGEGWAGGVINAVFAGGPLLAVGAGLRSADPRIARWTARGALAASVIVAFVLVMQALDENETLVNQAITAMALLAYLLAAAVELPSLRKPRV